MNAALFVERLGAMATGGELAHVEEMAQRDAVHGSLRHKLDDRLATALRNRGQLRMYTHQAKAIDAALDGRDTAIVTPTASGKSLCYHVPVAEALLTDPSAHALYLFPTKALTQDQLGGLRELLPRNLAEKVAIYDGDTPQAERRGVRQSTRVLLTNPDMLQLGILPNHRSWSRLLSSLRYVVIDEAHIYRGVFGSHVANVCRRLRRLCAHYRSNPVFILCSATIANPGEIAEGLIGKPVEVINENGAPHGSKHFVFWNPPFHEERGVRTSTGDQTARLLKALLRDGIRTLAFVRTRRQAEVVYVNVRDRLADEDPELARRVSPYRASYLPEDRRSVERGLLNGDLLGAVTTNALELGIDIGDLDATLMSGYPGSIASTWQQAGRSGRKGDGSLSVLVAQDNPLDQYLMRNPDFFFGSSHEYARMRPGNPYVLGPHLKAAAHELPLTSADTELFGEGFEAQVSDLTAKGDLQAQNGRWCISSSVNYPAGGVNIRSISHQQFQVVESQSKRELERVDAFSAFSQLHAGAIYLHFGESYIVESLDLGSRTAYVNRTDLPYYTVSRVRIDVRVIKTRSEKTLNGAQVCVGEVEVSNQVTSYRKRGLYSERSEEDLGEEPLDLPPQRFHTTAVWFDLPAPTLSWAIRERVDLMGGLHAMEHAAIGVLPFFAMCDRNDIGGVSTTLHPDTGKSQVFIYDGHPGGVGISEHGYEVIEQLLSATLDVVSKCQCAEADGCPSCVQSPKCGNNNDSLNKDVASRFLRGMLGHKA